MKKKNLIVIFTCMFSIATVNLGLFNQVGFAEETIGEKVENKVDEVKKDARKKKRANAKKRRDAKGQGSIVKDAEDAAANVGDEISHGAKKIKNQVD